MSILSTTNTGLHGPVTEDFLLSLGLEKHKYYTDSGDEKFAFYNKDILPMTFRITFYNRHDKDNPFVCGTNGDHSIQLKSKEKVLLYMNYVKLTRELQQDNFNSTEKLNNLVLERFKIFNKILH